MAEISYVPQRFVDTLFPWLSIPHNLCIRLIAPGRLEDTVESYIANLWDELRPSLDAGADETLYGYFGLTDDVGTVRHVTRLSGGQQQVVAVLRALLPCPRLLLLDEPFSALDIYRGASFRRALLRHVEANQISTILVTHDLDEAVEFCDKVIVLAPGQEGASKVANMYDVGNPRSGPNLAENEKRTLVRRIKDENGIQ